jgi:hypothetical protein
MHCLYASRLLARVSVWPPPLIWVHRFEYHTDCRAVMTRMVFPSAISYKPFEVDPMLMKGTRRVPFRDRRVTICIPGHCSMIPGITSRPTVPR